MKKPLTILIILLGLALTAGGISAQTATPIPTPVFLTTPQGLGAYHVALLIVDDFTGVEVASTTSSQYQSGQNCGVNLEGQAFITRGMSATPITVPHGQLVYNELIDLVLNVGASSYITPVQVDMANLTTADIATAISDAMTANPADAYAINMSFAIIPCEFIDALAQNASDLAQAQQAGDGNNYRNLFQRAVTFYNGQVFPANSQHFQNATNLDPIQTLLSTVQANTLPVSSAGNFGLNYPFWPGAWGQVVSVSASTGEAFQTTTSWDKRTDAPLMMTPPLTGQRATRVSNYGEVMMPGDLTTPDFGLVSGTSFAAPRLSLEMALYLSAVGSNFCHKPDGTPALAYGDWKNLTLLEAATAYCPDLLPYLPQ
jgi:subtilase family protein